MSTRLEPALTYLLQDAPNSTAGLPQFTESKMHFSLNGTFGGATVIIYFRTLSTLPWQILTAQDGFQFAFTGAVSNMAIAGLPFRSEIKAEITGGDGTTSLTAFYTKAESSVPALPSLSLAMSSTKDSFDIRALPSDKLQPIVLPHLNPIHGDEMAIDAAFAEEPEAIMYRENLGTGEGEYDASAIVGGANWVFDSTDQNHTPAGSKSIKATAVESGDIMQLDNGSCPTCSAITGWIYITKWDELKNNHLALYSWNTGSDEIQGNEVLIDDYITQATLNKWQPFVIPLTNLGITGVESDAYRLEVRSDLGEPLAPDFYLDDIQLEEPGGGEEYLLPIPPGFWFHACFYSTTFIGVPDGWFANSGVPKIDPDKCFNILALTNGIVNIITLSGFAVESINVKNLGQYMQDISEMVAPIFFGSDEGSGKVTYKLQIPLCTPLTLKPENGDNSRVILSENTTGWGSMKLKLGGILEQRF